MLRFLTMCLSVMLAAVFAIGTGPCMCDVRHGASPAKGPAYAPVASSRTTPCGCPKPDAPSHEAPAAPCTCGGTCDIAGDDTQKVLVEANQAAIAAERLELASPPVLTPKLKLVLAAWFAGAVEAHATPLANPTHKPAPVLGDGGPPLYLSHRVLRI